MPSASFPVYMKSHLHQAWPRDTRDSHETACHFCDTLFTIEQIKEGEKATCPTCNQVLFHNRPRSLERAVAFSSTGVILFGILLLFPFIQLTAQGNVIVMSVPLALEYLWLTGGAFIAISIVFFVITLPLAQLLLLLYICIPLFVGKTLPFVTKAAKLLYAIQPWVMLEVFFIGTLVSLIKLVKLADVELLLGFWSLIALMLCIAGALSAIDKLELWDRIEVSLKNRQKT